MQYEADFVSHLENHLYSMDDYLRAWEIVKDMMLKNTADFTRIEPRAFSQSDSFFERTLN